MKRLEKSIIIKKFELTLELIKDFVSNLCLALGNNEQHYALNSHLEFPGPTGSPGPVQAVVLVGARDIRFIFDGKLTSVKTCITSTSN